ncbi:Fe3+/spermidine/putrescine ABC transporter ATP-binding protein [Falsiroseomonas bella]|uniref:Fe3+/spermidine/putrescine ABC transporter ATP-binding protein n=1 Tax=Falsiroseomonas bella TaxID=2184016 RepID=A0A317FKS4_9PROT|nr:ABC transporter ATP-binding protein [Falsiroseomonas bella]PWS38962.1 Fe3+/spermidine/putrescine ABC transporter ATP-binding protein [Falsiroseomonas bella]
MTQIEIAGVGKRFGAHQVLRDCTLSIARGQVLTLLGASGCGKTTLLRIIAGFLDPDEGEVRIQGRDITTLPPNRRQVGYVFQNYALFPHLTVAENVAYGLKVRRRPRAEIADRVRAALETVALAGFADRYPARLSGGQQQRVAIARALVLEPEVLLLDEPFNALDAKLRLAMQVELRKLISRVGITSIFVTHDQAEAMTLSDQVAVMREGRIEQLAAPLDLYDRPATPYVATFIGRANVVPVTVRGGAVEGVPGVAAARADGPAALVLRPENLRLLAAGAPGVVWNGRVAFATADGPTMELELDAGLAEPLRAVLPRRAGEAAPAAGTLLGLGIADPAGCAVIPHAG